MKKLLLLFSVLLLSACSLNDDEASTDMLYEYAPVVSVELPESLVFGQSYTFKITYTFPSPCHKLFGFEYVPQHEVHFLGIVTSYEPNNPLCTDNEGRTEVFEWEFTADTKEKHIFKFWQGVDQDGDPIYLTKEVEVQDVI